MRAAVLEAFGDAHALRYGEAEDPVPRRGSTVVRLRAAALNWHDVLVRQGRYESPLPHVPGADGAGTSTETGDEVVVLPSLWWGSDEAAPADGWEILGDHRPGTYAEFVQVPSEAVFAMPAGLDAAQAAGLALVGVTAFRALVSRGRLGAGDSVLILGAGGGIAPMAVSIAAGIGAHAFVTSSSDAKVEAAVERAAASAVTAIGGRGFDVVLDSVGTWTDSIRALRPGGRLVVLGASRAGRVTVDIRSFYFGQYGILGTTMGSPADFRGLLALLDDGVIAPPVIDRTFPLAEAAVAHSYLESGAAFGKIVLEID